LPSCQPVPIWSSIWAVLPPFFPRKKPPRTLAFLCPPSAAGAARTLGRHSFGLVACCGTVARRSKHSSPRIPRQLHSEAGHGA